MTATVTRTLQAPQYAPINMTLTEECTPDTFTATLNKLADLIENTLRERYPQYAGVLPIVQKKAVNNHPPFQDEIKVKGNPMSAADLVSAPTTMKGLKAYFKPADKVITRQKGAALIECINDCTSLQKLKEYEKDLDTTEAEIAYNDKLVQLQNNNTLCTQ
jgi:hypothetical protein